MEESEDILLRLFSKIKKHKTLVWGILLVGIPLVIMAYYMISYTGSLPHKSLFDAKGFGNITIDHPPVGFFDRYAQLLVSIGLCLASISWGISKIIKAVRG
jgi:hypothetical protein